MNKRLTTPAKLCINSASNLPNADTFPKNVLPDAFAVVSYGGSECRTRHINDNANPVWNACCYVGDALDVGGQITLTLWDDDTLEDEVMFTATHSIVEGGQTISLAGGGEVSLTFTPGPYLPYIFQGVEHRYPADYGLSECSEHGWQPEPSCANDQMVESSRLATSRFCVEPTLTDDTWW